MAIGVYFTFTGLNATTYGEAIKLLRQAGASHPAGRSYHSSFGPPDKLMVFDVWSSQAAFERFGKTLMPILASLGVKPSPPELMPIHKVITPPAVPAKRKTKARKKK
jgi:hypothetical protein